jgi:hypothetical protein
VPSIGYFSTKIQDKKVDSFLRKERAKITWNSLSLFCKSVQLFKLHFRWYN